MFYFRNFIHLWWWSYQWYSAEIKYLVTTKCGDYKGLGFNWTPFSITIQSVQVLSIVLSCKTFKYFVRQWFKLVAAKKLSFWNLITISCLSYLPFCWHSVVFFLSFLASANAKYYHFPLWSQYYSPVWYLCRCHCLLHSMCAKLF